MGQYSLSFRCPLGLEAIIRFFFAREGRFNPNCAALVRPISYIVHRPTASEQRKSQWKYGVIVPRIGQLVTRVISDSDAKAADDVHKNYSQTDISTCWRSLQ